MLEQTWDICCEYNIPVSPWTTLSHAEVQQTLGVAQRNKWDYMVLPCYDKPSDAVKIGNVLRARMLEKFG